MICYETWLFCWIVFFSVAIVSHRRENYMNWKFISSDNFRRMYSIMTRNHRNFLARTTTTKREKKKNKWKAKNRTGKLQYRIHIHTEHPITWSKFLFIHSKLLYYIPEQLFQHSILISIELLWERMKGDWRKYKELYIFVLNVLFK